MNGAQAVGSAACQTDGGWLSESESARASAGESGEGGLVAARLVLRAPRALKKGSGDDELACDDDVLGNCSVRWICCAAT